MAETSGRNSAFLLAQSLLTCTNYTMTTRDAKGSHSGPNLPDETKKTQVDFFKYFDDHQKDHAKTWKML